MPKILVTGATGTFGSLLAQRLRQEGEQVRVMVRDPSRFILEGIEVTVGDFCETERVFEALSGIDRMFLASFDTGVNGGVKACHCGGAKVGQFGFRALERAALE